MQRTWILIVLAAASLLTLRAFADAPTTQPQITKAATILGLPIEQTTRQDIDGVPKPVDSYKVSDFDLKWRPVPKPPAKIPFFGYGTVISKQQSSIQNWKSF